MKFDEWIETQEGMECINIISYMKDDQFSSDKRRWQKHHLKRAFDANGQEAITNKELAEERARLCEFNFRSAIHEVVPRKFWALIDQHMQKPPEMLRFCDLPKGTRFKYPDGKGVWVVLEEYGNGLIARWDGVHSSRILQSICCFVDEEWSLESKVEVVPQ